MLLEKESPILILGYWGIRRRAQVLRLLLTYTDQKWENKIYHEI
jgi:hypothetical protein